MNKSKLATFARIVVTGVLFSSTAFHPMALCAPDHQPLRDIRQADSMPAAPLTTAEQVLEKYVQAIGGKAAILQQSSRVMKGSITVPSIGATGTIEVYSKAPNKELTEIASSVIGNSRTGFNGIAAWMDEDGEVKDLSSYAKRDADFYLPVKLLELYPRIELKGKETVGGREAFRLEAARGGAPKRWYFDTQTALLLRTEVRNSQDVLLVREDYEDYQAVDGIRIPFTTNRLDRNNLVIVIKYREVRHNVQIDDSRFEKPGRKSPSQTASIPKARDYRDTLGRNGRIS